MNAPALDTDAQDRSDMQRLARGHDAALSELMERHGERLFHYLIRQVQNETDAADLAQETFVRVYKNRDRYNSSQKFSTWLYTIATNAAKDRLKWRSRHPELSLEAPVGVSDTELGATLPASERSPDVNLVQDERARAVQQAIAALPDELRAPLIMAQYENMAANEIGEILGCTRKAIESRLYRARIQLREQLAKWVGDT